MSLPSNREKAVQNLHTKANGLDQKRLKQLRVSVPDVVAQVDDRLQKIGRSRHVPFRTHEPTVRRGVLDIGPQTLALRQPAFAFGTDAKPVFQRAVCVHFGKRDEVIAVLRIH